MAGTDFNGLPPAESLEAEDVLALQRGTGEGSTMKIAGSVLMAAMGGSGSGGRTIKQQVFTSSGTFTPSQALLDAGGAVEVLLVGEGAAAASPTSAVPVVVADRWCAV